MSSFNYEEWRKHVSETENLEGLTMPQLKEQLGYFNGVCGCREVVTDQTPYGKKNICDERIRLLRAEIQHRRARKPSWVSIVSLIIAGVSLCLGVYNCSRSASTPAEARATPTPAATPGQSPTGTRSQ